MTHPYLLALHIIFVVAWFAGLFYLVRLYIYHTEANNRQEPDRSILIAHFKKAERNLLNIITWPAMIGTYIFGFWYAYELFGGFFPGWLIMKLALVLGLNTAAGAQEKKAAKKSAAAEEQETKIAKKDVPAAVIAAFEKAYPKATMKGFSREMEKGKTVYEVESVEGKMTRDATYSADGKLQVVEESVEMKDVPAAVQQALEKKYPKAKVNRAEKVMEGSSVGYEFHVTTAQGKKAEVKFDAAGKEVKR